MEEQQMSQAAEQQLSHKEKAVNLEEGLTKIPKGYALFEGLIKDLSFLNPENQAKRNQFLNDEDKKTERKELLKKLEFWADLVEKNDDVSQMVTTALNKSQTAEKLLNKNVKKLLNESRELETSYTSMDLFYKNSAEKKIKNLSIVNASIDDLTTGDDFYNLISNEIQEGYERLDLSDNYSILCVPGYFGKNTKMERWGKLYESGSPSYSIIDEVSNTYFLVNLVDNDYPKGSCLWKVLDAMFEYQQSISKDVKS